VLGAKNAWTALLAESRRHQFGDRRPMLALTDDQLGIVMNAASGLPVEKRTVFLERSPPGWPCAAHVSPMPMSTTRCESRSKG